MNEQGKQQGREIGKEIGPLSAYGEYTEEAQRKSAEKVFIPVNHLVKEKSIYLQRQAGSPIGWYSWCDDAFDTAGREDRPIFLNIGYSSSHWCGVMDTQCFSNVEVALLMNSSLLVKLYPIRVDKNIFKRYYITVPRKNKEGGSFYMDYRKQQFVFSMRDKLDELAYGAHNLAGACFIPEEERYFENVAKNLTIMGDMYMEQYHMTCGLVENRRYQR